MKAVILAGGLGTRMSYYTHRVTNKHLIYVYDRAMIEYPLSSIVEAGIKDVTVVMGSRHAGKIIEYLGNGREFGLSSLHFGYQHGEGGIADALRCAKPFVGKNPVCVILADNLFEGSLHEFVNTYKGGGKILLKEVPDPTSFGVATVDETGKVLRVVEKPKNPESNLAIVGAYIFDYDVFDVIETLKPSGRGELEVTDLIQHYLDQGKLESTVVKGYWTDMGSPDSLLDAANFIRNNPSSFDRLKLFKIDNGLSVPLSQLEGWKNTLASGQNLESTQKQMEFYVKTLKKWNLSS
jgi:glucose-1-phosphate thymidylyltransferase